MGVSSKARIGTVSDYALLKAMLERTPNASPEIEVSEQATVDVIDGDDLRQEPGTTIRLSKMTPAGQTRDEEEDQCFEFQFNPDGSLRGMRFWD